MEEKIAFAIALFRFRMIAPALEKDLFEQKAYFAAQAEKIWDVPHYGRKRFSVATFKSWLSDYRKKGFDSLLPATRQDAGISRKITPSLAEQIVGAASRLKEATTVAAFYRHLSAQQIINPPHLSQSALRRFAAANKLFEQQGEPKARKKFEKEHVNQLWMADFMHGPYLQAGKIKRKAILCDCIDDHSRMIVGSLWSFSESAATLECLLKSAVSRFGLPSVLYVDNGSAFSCEQIEVACARLGIVLIHSKPYDSPSRGKIERFHRTVRDKFLSMLDLSQIDCIQTLNEHFAAWLASGYHNVIHSGIGTTPMDRWNADLQSTSLRYLTTEELHFAFCQTFKRKVKNDSTIRLQGRLWQAPPAYIGKTIEVRYPTDLPDEVYLFENNKPVARLSLCDPAANATPPASAVRFSDCKEDDHD